MPPVALASDEKEYFDDLLARTIEQDDNDSYEDNALYTKC
jgi:hypothetical protein